MHLNDFVAIGKYFIFVADNKVTAKIEESVEIVIKVMNAQMSNNEICNCACGTLGNIALNCKMTIIAMGIIDKY